MDPALQINGPEKVFCIPHGLRELSNDIVREVLRFQPENIYGFISDYLDTMLEVREKVRESAEVIEDIYMQGYFLNNLYKSKGIGKEDADMYATRIQANWRGYVVRKKLSDYIRKKQKFEEEKERKKSQKIEEILSSFGITLDEDGKTKPGKWVVDEDGREFWVEDIPLSERVKEEQRAFGRSDRWEREEYEDYFEIDEETGEILYDWPKTGQLRKIPRDEVPLGVEIIQFFGMRDLQGKEQYSYLKEPQHDEEKHGTPVGFLIPAKKDELNEGDLEIAFAKTENKTEMGDYTYVFREEPERTDLIKFFETVGSRTSFNKRDSKSESRTSKTSKDSRKSSKTSADENQESRLLPRILIRIQKEFIQEGDEEVRFSNEENDNWINRDEAYTFKAENLKQTAKIIKYIMQNSNIPVPEALQDIINRTPYKTRLVGRFLPVENFETPKNIQKIEIIPESATGKAEMEDLDQYEYVFLPKGFRPSKPLPKREPVLQIPISRFQGYHTEYQGSNGLEKEKIFIMGPMLPSPDGKPFTYESMFWDDYGTQAWYQHLHNITTKEIPEEEEDLFDFDIVEETEAKPAVSVKRVFSVKSKKSKSKTSGIASKRSTPQEITPIEIPQEVAEPPQSPEPSRPMEAIEVTNIQETPEPITQITTEKIPEEEEKTPIEVTDTEEEALTTDTDTEFTNTEEESDQANSSDQL